MPDCRRPFSFSISHFHAIFGGGSDYPDPENVAAHCGILKAA